MQAILPTYIQEGLENCYKDQRELFFTEKSLAGVLALQEKVRRALLKMIVWVSDQQA